MVVEEVQRYGERIMVERGLDLKTKDREEDWRIPDQKIIMMGQHNYIFYVISF